MIQHPSYAELEEGLTHIRQAPDDDGVVEMIVSRPGTDERVVLAEGTLDAWGLVGDRWGARGRQRDGEGGAKRPDTQITLMNARVIELLAGSKDRWPAAGDQLFVDFDLSLENLSAGTLLTAGSAVLEISEVPHTGCEKFAARFGADALAFVNSAIGRSLRLRGVYASVHQAGVVQVGDVISKLAGD
jgi:MOSC domain-containing protein YiiM